jgi:hypothetical protein
MFSLLWAAILCLIMRTVSTSKTDYGFGKEVKTCWGSGKQFPRADLKYESAWTWLCWNKEDMSRLHSIHSGGAGPNVGSSMAQMGIWLD